MHYPAAAFWLRYHTLPADVQQSADRAFELLKQDPYHPSLHFKKVSKYWSARVGVHYRALAVRDGENFIWFWIGSHADYDKLLRES